MHTWTRGATGALSAYFTAKEFTCKCGVCRDQRVSKELIKKLDLVRAAVGPITITSGFRCGLHQANLTKQGLNTAKNSTHCIGQAADITCGDLAALFTACEAEFKAIGTAATFLHVDLRADKVRRWSY